jgi:hypothetical protein
MESSLPAYEVTVTRSVAAAPTSSVLPGALYGSGQTPRSVAAEYARDAERRKGEPFVLPALHVPKIRLAGPF